MARVVGGLGMTEGSKGPKGQHGGRRVGAGRKVKFDLFFMLKVGAACEELNRSGFVGDHQLK